MKKFVTYIIKSESIGKFYIGYTSDIGQRLDKHNSGFSRWTKRGIPWEIVYLRPFSTKHEAIIHERYLKSLKNKAYLNNIIAGWRSSISSGP